MADVRFKRRIAGSSSKLQNTKGSMNLDQMERSSSERRLLERHQARAAAAAASAAAAAAARAQAARAAARARAAAARRRREIEPDPEPEPRKRHTFFCRWWRT